VRGARRVLVAGVQRVQYHAVLCAHDPVQDAEAGVGAQQQLLVRVRGRVRVRVRVP